MNDPGRLNRRLVLERPVESADGAGGVVRGYETAAMIWASLRPASAIEQLDAARLSHSVTHRLSLRWRDDVTASHRLRDGSRVFEIVALRDRDGERRFLDISALERTD